MILLNRSGYDTRCLRRLVCAVYRRLAAHEGSLPTWRRLEIEAQNTQSPYIEGEATVGGSDLLLKLPTPTRYVLPIRWVAYLVDHELQHVYGYDHRQMSRRSKDWEPRDLARFAWVERLLGQRQLPRKGEA